MGVTTVLLLIPFLLVSLRLSTVSGDLSRLELLPSAGQVHKLRHASQAVLCAAACAEYGVVRVPCRCVSCRVVVVPCAEYGVVSLCVVHGPVCVSFICRPCAFSMCVHCAAVDVDVDADMDIPFSSPIG